MSQIVARLTGDSATTWAVDWLVDGKPSGSTVTISSADSNDLLAASVQFEQAFNERGHDGGGRLRLFPPALLAQMGKALADLTVATTLQTATGDRHRLVVQSTQPDLLNLPWELMPAAGSDLPIGCRRDWAIFRSPGEFSTDRRALPPGPLRILFLASAPVDQQLLHYELEEEAILSATLSLHGAQVFLSEQGTFDELKDLISDCRPHVVHLSGHGKVDERGVGQFCFEDETGHTHLVQAKELVEQALAGSGVQCVFLNACQTSRAAVAGLCQSLVAAGVPSALGWAASVADDRATRFAEKFYDALVRGEPVPAAVAVARLSLKVNGFLPQAAADRGDLQDPTYVLPQLYCRVPVERLLDPNQAPEPAPVSQTVYHELGSRIPGLKTGFIGRRREQQQLLPKLRSGDYTCVVLHGPGGQGKSTLVTRLVNQLFNRLKQFGYRVLAIKSVQQKGESAGQCGARTASQLLSELHRHALRIKDEDLAAILSENRHSTEMKLSFAADELNKWKLLLVLDNWEDVLDLETRTIADPALAAFYERVTNNLVDGSRVFFTTRYIPHGTPEDLTHCHVRESLPDFTEAEFLKFLRCDEKLLVRLGQGELSRELLHRLFQAAGGTPRFLGQIRTILRSLSSAELSEALLEQGLIEQEREKYLETLFGPKLLALLSVPARNLVQRLALSSHALPLDALKGLLPTELEIETAVTEGIAYGLILDLRPAERPVRYVIPSVWRDWLASQLDEASRRATHVALAQFWKHVFETDLENDLEIGITDGLETAREHAKQGGNNDLFVWSTFLLASRHRRVSEFRRAAAILDEIPQDLREAQWKQLRADIHLSLSEWLRARQLYQEVLTAEEHCPNFSKEELAATWHNLATIDLNEGNYTPARESFCKSLEIKQAIGDQAGEAATWANLATIDLREGKYAAAREGFRKSLEMMQAIGDRAGEAATWHQLASIDLKEGNYAAARENFRKSLKIKQEVGDKAREAATWHQLATIDVHERNYTAARESFRKSLEIDQAIGDRAGEAGAWHQLASIDLREGNYAAARQGFRKSLEMRQSIGDRAGEAATWHGLASFDLDEGNYAAAREIFRKSLEMNQAIGDRAGEAATFSQLGACAYREGNLRGAAQLVGLCFVLDQAIGHGEAESVLNACLGLCQKLGYDQTQVMTMLSDVNESYQQDRGATLLRDIFGENL